MTPKISVVMASYNHAAFVQQAVESALTQSFTDLEVVITDDGSRDGTADVIRRMADPRISLEVLADNQGACVAVNRALGRVRGEYVAVLNSDDYFLPGKLARQAAFLDAHPEIGAVFGQPQFVDERGRPFANPSHAFPKIYSEQNYSRREWLKRFFYFGNSLCHPTVLIRKSCYERVGKFDPLLMQLPDLDFWVRLCREYEIHILPEPLTAFRILDREQNTSAPSKERLARSAWETCTILGHYAALPEAELRAIFPAVMAAEPGRSPKISLALEAIHVGKPGYAAFGLNLLRECMQQAPGIFPPEKYFQLVGAADPLSAEFFGKEYQLLKKSGGVARARRLLRWWRSLNLRG
jgi:hypothetical protein